MKRQHVPTVSVLEVISQRETFGPVCAVAVADLEHPRAVGPVAAVHQKNTPRQRRAAVGPAADFQSKPCTATFQCAKTHPTCHVKSCPRSREVSRSCL